MHFPANALNKRDLGFEAEVPFVKVKYSLIVAKKYTNLLFLDENATIDGLPDEIKNMLDQTLLHK